MGVLVHEVEIKLLKTHHVPEIIKVWEAAGLELKPKGRDLKEKLIQQMSLSFIRFIGAFFGNALVGIVIVNHEGRKGWINRLAVLPEFQHKGIAAKLLKAAEKWLEDEGIGIFAALIMEKNFTSRRFFEKAKYVEFQGVCYYTKRLFPDV